MKTTDKRGNEFYTYCITWAEEDQMFVGECAEFPSLSWLAETQEKALKGIKDVVLDVVIDIKNNGEEVPPPLSVKKYSGRLSLRISPEVHRKIATCAAIEKISINRYINSKII